MCPRVGWSRGCVNGTTQLSTLLPIHPHLHLFTHPPMNSSIYPYLFIHHIYSSTICTSTCLSSYSPTLIHLSIHFSYTTIHLSAHSSNYSFIHPSIHQSFIHPYHLSIHSLSHSFIYRSLYPSALHSYTYIHHIHSLIHASNNHVSFIYPLTYPPFL